MAKAFADKFYKSVAWVRTREAYARSVNHLCEDCLAAGKMTPGEIVHHIEPLTPENIKDPGVSLNWKNLRLLCRECHAARHGARVHRWRIDPGGRVSIK